MKIHLLAIEHKHGVNFYPCASELILRRELANYVREWWNEIQGLDGVPNEPPADDGEAIDLYFEVCETESYIIEEADLIAE